MGSYLGLRALRETGFCKEMGLFNLSKSKGENLGNIFSSKKQFMYLRLQHYLHDIYQTISYNCSFFHVSVLISPGMIYLFIYTFYHFLGQFFKQLGFYLLIRATIFLFCFINLYFCIISLFIFLLALFFFREMLEFTLI